MSIGKDQVTVIIPTLNEEKAIGSVLDELLDVGCKNILIIDGHSIDNTVKIAESKGIRVIQQDGRGKTGALKTGLNYVNTPYIIVMDGDFTYCAKDIERLLIAGEHYSQVIGVRDLENIGSVHRIGNWLITHTFSLLLGMELSDVCSGMYLLRTDIAHGLELNSSGFRTEIEILAQTVMDDDVTEVPINYRPRIGKRKLSTWRDGIGILTAIFNLARKYNPVFLFSAITGLCILPAGFILVWLVYNFVLFGFFDNWWAMVGLFLVLLASQALTVSTISLLLKRTERRIMNELRKEKNDHI